MPSGENARRLLDNGWQVVLFKDGLGQYTALACRDDESIDEAIEEWANHEANHPMDGPNRYAGCHFSINQALEAVTEKVLFARLPGMTTDECQRGLDQ